MGVESECLYCNCLIVVLLSVSSAPVNLPFDPGDHGISFLKMKDNRNSRFQLQHYEQYFNPYYLRSFSRVYTIARLKQCKQQ